MTHSCVGVCSLANASQHSKLICGSFGMPMRIVTHSFVFYGTAIEAGTILGVQIKGKRVHLFINRLWDVGIISNSFKLSLFLAKIPILSS